MTDSGCAALATSIYTVEANYALRGLDIAPVPEPSTVALLALSAFAVATHRFRARRRVKK